MIWWKICSRPKEETMLNIVRLNYVGTCKRIGTAFKNNKPVLAPPGQNFYSYFCTTTPRTPL